MKTIEIKRSVRTVADFPKKGISFLDISTTLEDPNAFNATIDQMIEMVEDHEIDKIVGLDARGFIFASVLSYKLNVGLVIARKKGKLPFKTVTCSYGLEYGESELELHSDSILPGEKVLIVDDVLATGGTAEAAMKLSEELGGDIVGLLFFAEIMELNGRSKLNGCSIKSLLEY